MTTRAPSASRDIQKRTGWNYHSALAVVRAIGYDAVSKAIDDLGVKFEEDVFAKFKGL